MRELTSPFFLGMTAAKGLAALPDGARLSTGILLSLLSLVSLPSLSLSSLKSLISQPIRIPSLPFIPRIPAAIPISLIPAPEATIAQGTAAAKGLAALPDGARLSTGILLSLLSLVSLPSLSLSSLKSLISQPIRIPPLPFIPRIPAIPISLIPNIPANPYSPSPFYPSYPCRNPNLSHPSARDHHRAGHGGGEGSRRPTGLEKKSPRRHNCLRGLC